MRCPCCGAIGVQSLTFLESLRAQAWKVMSLGAFISLTVTGQAELIGEPWRHYVTVIGVICSAEIARNITQHPVKEIA